MYLVNRGYSSTVSNICVGVCPDITGKEPYRQVGIDRLIDSGSPDRYNGFGVNTGMTEAWV